jgi:hypothetical protein
VALPITTTTISIRRRAQVGDVDPWTSDGQVWITVASGVAATIHSHGGSSVDDAASRETRRRRLAAEGCDLRHEDRVVDDLTGEVFEVQSVASRSWPERPELDHVAADLLQIAGEV